MAKVVVLGAGISGHTAVSYLSRGLKKPHEVVMVSPNSNFQWVPSNIWVGVGLMTPDQVKFPLAPVYKRMGVDYKQALAVSINPDGDKDHKKGFVTIKYVSEDRKDVEEKVTYDYLINKGIDASRISEYKGFGEQKLINQCDGTIPCTEAQHQLNRRTQFIVIRME